MARWVLLGATILGWVLVFSAKSAGLLGLGLFCGVVGFFAFIFVLAADRVSASARPESSMAAVDDLAAMRKPVARLPAKPNQAAATSSSNDTNSHA